MTEFEKMTDKRIAMTEGEFATLGGGVVAYIKDTDFRRSQPYVPCRQGAA